MLLLLLAAVQAGPFAVPSGPECAQPTLRRAGDDHPSARPQTLNREPLADQEKAVMRRDGNGCMVPVKVREDVGATQQR